MNSCPGLVFDAHIDRRESHYQASILDETSTIAEDLDVLSVTGSHKSASNSITSTKCSTRGSRSTSLRDMPSTTKPRFPDSIVSGSAPKVLQRSPGTVNGAAAVYQGPDIREALMPLRHASSSAASFAAGGNEPPQLPQPNPSTDTTADWAELDVVPARKRRRSSSQQVAATEPEDVVYLEGRRSSISSRTSATDVPSPAPYSPRLDQEALESTPSLASKTEPYNANSSSTTPETSLERPSHSNSPKTRRASAKIIPVFHPSHPETRSISEIIYAIFELMKKPLSDRKDLDKGHIYTLRIPERPGYIKIGRTKDTIRKRQSQINVCIKYALEAINDDDRCKVPNHTRVETLIHTELYNYREFFSCTCRRKSNSRQHDCEGFGGSTKHGEWFKIDETKAAEVVGRWRTWMSSKPYCDGALRPTEKMRIEDYSENLDRMNSMITANGKDWRWDKFMRFSRLRLCFIWLRIMLHEERHKGRPVKLTRSRWDSLWTDWQVNLLFYFTFFVFSLMISVVSNLLPSTVGFVPVFPLINSVTLGSWAILYAA